MTDGGGKEIKNKEEMLQLLEVVWKLRKWQSFTAGATRGEPAPSVEETDWQTQQRGRLPTS